MSIMTGRGDEGETDLLFGRRIAKTSIRIAALGAVDELNAALGLARAASADPRRVELVDGIQSRLVGLMGQLACLPDDLPAYAKKGFASLEAADLDWLIDQARAIEAAGVRFQGWARPGAEGSVARAALDFARAIARRAEREVLLLHEREGGVPETVRLFFNRLSDLLWLLARVEDGAAEESA